MPVSPSASAHHRRDGRPVPYPTPHKAETIGNHSRPPAAAQRVLPTSFRIIGTGTSSNTDQAQSHALRAALRVAYRLISCPRGERVINALLSSPNNSTETGGERGWYEVPVDPTSLSDQHQFLLHEHFEFVVDSTIVNSYAVSAEKITVVHLHQDLVRGAGVSYGERKLNPGRYEAYILLLSLAMAEGIVCSMRHKSVPSAAAEKVSVTSMELEGPGSTARDITADHCPSFSQYMLGDEIVPRFFPDDSPHAAFLRCLRGLYVVGRSDEGEYWYNVPKADMSRIVQGGPDWERVLPLRPKPLHVVIPGRPDGAQLSDLPLISNQDDTAQEGKEEECGASDDSQASSSDLDEPPTHESLLPSYHFVSDTHENREWLTTYLNELHDKIDGPHSPPLFAIPARIPDTPSAPSSPSSRGCGYRYTAAGESDSLPGYPGWAEPPRPHMEEPEWIADDLDDSVVFE